MNAELLVSTLVTMAEAADQNTYNIGLPPTTTPHPDLNNADACLLSDIPIITNYSNEQRTTLPLNDNTLTASFVKSMLVLDYEKLRPNNISGIVKGETPVIDGRENHSPVVLSGSDKVGAIQCISGLGGVRKEGESLSSSVPHPIAVCYLPIPGPPTLEMSDTKSGLCGEQINVVTRRIYLGEAHRIGIIPIARLQDIAPNRLANTKAFEGYMIARPAIQNLAFEWNYRLDQYDMASVYAKLAYYAMIRRRFVDDGVVPVVNPFEQNDNPLYIDLSIAENWTVDNLRSPNSRNGMFFSDDYGYDPAHYLFYRIMVSTTPYFDIPVDGRRIPGLYFVSPAIPVTIMNRNAGPPGPPIARDILPEEWWAMMQTWAQIRNEYDDMIRDIYMAAEIVFADSIWQHHVDPNHRRQQMQLTCYFEAIPPRWPTPTDRNWIYILMGIPAKEVEDIPAEALSFLSSPTWVNQSMMVLYYALTRAAATTTFYSMNITGTDIQAWLRQTGTSDLMNAVFGGGLFHNEQAMTPANPLGNAGFFDIVTNLRETMTGVNFATVYNIRRAWNKHHLPAAEVGLGNHFFAARYPHQAPRVGSVLALDQWIMTRPIEWGVSGPAPDVNFNDEVQIAGAPEGQGWFAQRGAIAEYNRISTGPEPYELVAHTPAAMTAVCQIRYPDEPPIISWVNSDWWNGIPLPAWSFPNAQLFPQPPYNLALHIFEPCTVMTYDFSTGRVLAPCITLANDGMRSMQALKIQRGPAALVGFEPTVAREYRQPRIALVGRLAGMRRAPAANVLVEGAPAPLDVDAPIPADDLAIRGFRPQA